MWYIGIDVHKKTCNACIKDREGNILRELKFPNKSTGNMWLRLYLGLEEAGVDVVLANPKKTKAIASRGEAEE